MLSDKVVRVILDLQPKGGTGALASKLAGLSGSSSGGGGGILAFAAAAGPYAAAAGAVATATIGATAAMNAFAKAASPFLAGQQDQAWKDLYAVMGRAFLPVLQTITHAIRTVADVFQNLLPSAGEFNEIFEALRPVMDAFRDLFKEIAALMRPLIAEGLQELVAIIKIGTIVTVQFVKAITFMVNKLREAIGLPALSSSFGASGFGASFGSAEDFAKQQAIAAMAAVGGGTDPARETADNTRAMAQGFKIFVDIITGQPGRAMIDAASLARP